MSPSRREPLALEHGDDASRDDRQHGPRRTDEVQRPAPLVRLEADRLPDSAFSASESVGLAGLPNGSDAERAAQETLLEDKAPAVVVLDLCGREWHTPSVPTDSGFACAWHRHSEAHCRRLLLVVRSATDAHMVCAVPNLIVCMEGDASDEDTTACRDAFAELMLDDWTHQPEFLDQVDAIPVYGPEELPALRTVGVLLALPEPESDVDEQAVREDVTRLIRTMSDLARRAQLAFVIEYREEEVGFLDGSARDDRFLTDFSGA
jgi:hypothetical protein